MNDIIEKIKRVIENSVEINVGHLKNMSCASEASNKFSKTASEVGLIESDILKKFYRVPEYVSLNELLEKFKDVKD
jgi:hypothetical protein